MRSVYPQSVPSSTSGLKARVVATLYKRGYSSGYAGELVGRHWLPAYVNASPSYIADRLEDDAMMDEINQHH